jgi:alpha-L-arabinofuranosidase
MTHSTVFVGFIITAMILFGWIDGKERQARNVEADTQVVFRIDADQQISRRQINRLIYGNFIELGFGRQADGMWAQMLDNRSFENIPPPSAIALSERGANCDSATPWWHSGYEEHPWYLYGPDGKTEIPPEREAEHWGFYHGKIAASVSHKGDGRWGIAQDGLWLRTGIDYLFRGFLVHNFSDPGNEQRNVVLKLVAENEPTYVIDSANLAVGTWFTECKATLRNRNYTGRASLLVEAAWPGEFRADDFELLPVDAIKGWRRDVVNKLKRVRPTMLRFPGGCFASFYDWRSGIGPRDDRMPLRSEFWGGLEYNDVGTDEYLDLCRELGAEPFLVINIMTGTPHLAAQWVEYCNGPDGSPMGRLRAANGHHERRKVTYWEMDNEVDRKLDPETYARRVVEFAKAMRSVDPSIKLVIIGYDSYAEKLSAILDICGRYIDFVSDRYYEEQDFARNISVLDAYRKKTGKRIGLCNTEWIAPGAPPPRTVEEIKDRSRLQRWYYAMNAAMVLQRFWRNADWMDFANFNNLVNTWGQNVVESGKSGAWLSCAGCVFEFYADSRAAWPVEVTPGQYDERIHVAAALSTLRDKLIINIINMGGETNLNITLGDQVRAWKLLSTRGIATPSLLSRNIETDQNVVVAIRPETEISASNLTVHLQGCSIVEIVLSKDR